MSDAVRITETSADIDRIMRCIRAGRTSGLEIFDVESGWTMTGLRMHSDGLVDYSGQPGTYRVFVSPHDIEERLRNGGLVEVGGPAMAEIMRINRVSALVADAGEECVAYVKTILNILNDRSVEIDDETYEILLRSDEVSLHQAVMRLARDRDYTLDEFRPDTAPAVVFH